LDGKQTIGDFTVGNLDASRSASYTNGAHKDKFAVFGIAEIFSILCV
jgi:hypothetical protein